MVSIFIEMQADILNVFNNSITVTVEPFIELLIRNIRATGTNVIFNSYGNNR
jgi:hypothetical protein